MKSGTLISGRYEVRRLLGEGGMGAVYEALHTGLGRRVAIKVLHANPARRDELMGRLEREARAAASIGHINIVEVHDFGLHEGMPFMVMEYLEGESLVTRLEAHKKLPIEDACYIMGQMLSALSAAHNAGIIHRDLKPENVYLVPRGDSEIVKLLDFGISKVMTTSQEGRALTRDGTVVGTPYYMSPEQAMARKELDAGGDIYSAGVMLYEMVTGTLPFYADNETEVLMAICRRDEEPKTPRELDPTIPEELDAVIRKAMAHKRADRFATAGEMLDALRPFGAATLSMVPERSTGRFQSVGVPSGIHASMSGDAMRAGFNSESGRTPLATQAEVPVRRKATPWIAMAVALTAVIALAGTYALTRRSSSTDGSNSQESAASRNSSSVAPRAAAPAPVPPTASASAPVPAAASAPAPASASASAPAPAAGTGLAPAGVSATSATGPNDTQGRAAVAAREPGSHRAAHRSAGTGTSGGGAPTNTAGQAPPTHAARRPRGAFIPATTEY